MHDGPGPIPSSGVRPVCPSDAGLCFDRPSCFCRVCAVHFLGGTKYFDPVSPFYYSSRLRSVSLFRSVPRINDTFVATPFERFVALPVSTRFSPDFQKGCVSGYAVFLLSPQPTGLRGSLYFRFFLSPSFWFLITQVSYYTSLLSLSIAFTDSPSAFFGFICLLRMFDSSTVETY